MKKDHIYIITFLFLFIDQLSKYIIKENLNLFEKIEIIPHFFSINYVQNEGAAWGILSNMSIVLTIISALFIILLNKYINKQNNLNKLSIISYGLLLGGVLGNLIDRILYNYVIDFLDFNIFGYNYPVFNIADIGIVIGCILLIINIIKEDYHDSKRCKQ